jgi:hypothetical protein
MNSLREGLRSRALILPGENRQEFEAELDQLIEDLQPCDGTEHKLVHDIASATWMHRRAKRAQFERLRSDIERASAREDEDVAVTLDRLFSDAGRPLALYCTSTAACGGPRTSAPENVDDSQKPLALVTRLEATAKGCQAMIECWREIADRVENNLEIQPHDRLRAIRMLCRQPVDVVLDQRVWLIYVASFGLHPAGKAHAFDDLKSDMGTIELEAFLPRVRSRWGLLLDASDTAGCRQALLDLVARNIEQLEAKREAHLEGAEESAASTAARLAYEESPQGERLARYELACERRTHRCRDAFWKHRRETSRAEQNAARRAEDGVKAVENFADSGGQSGVAHEASSAPIKNLTSEPNRGLNATEAVVHEEIAALHDVANDGINLLSRMRDLGIGTSATPVGLGGKGLEAIEASISGRGPLLRPIS